MKRRFDHVDLRVGSLEAVRAFYERLLPALGFTRAVAIEGWLQYEAAEGAGPATEFFGVTESPGHVPNENRIAFRAADDAEVERLVEVVASAGGRNIEGPGLEVPGYMAVFFEDPVGNRFEICHRSQ